MGRRTTEPTYGEIPDLRWRLVDSAGLGLLLGGAGGSAFHFIRGLCNSTDVDRLADAACAVGANAPRLAGSLAAYFAIKSALEAAVSRARRREDPWNSIAAGAAAWGLLDARLGARAAARSVLLGAAAVALWEGAYIVRNRVLAAVPQYDPPPPEPAWPGAWAYEPGVLEAPAAHRPTQGGFLGIPRQRIVVEEISVSDRPRARPWKLH